MDEGYYGLELPEDIEKEIGGYLENELQASRVSRRWGSSRVWCGEGFAKRMHEKPVTVTDVIRLFEEEGNPNMMFMMTKQDEDTFSGRQMSTRNTFVPRTGTRYIKKLYILDFKCKTLAIITEGGLFNFRSLDEGDTHIKPKVEYRDPFGNLEDMFELAGVLSPGVEYRFDPFTVRGVVNKRLKPCNLEDDSLWRYFPELRDPDYNLYVLGVDIIIKHLELEYLMRTSLNRLIQDAATDVVKYPEIARDFVFRY